MMQPIFDTRTTHYKNTIIIIETKLKLTLLRNRKTYRYTKNASS